MKTLLSLLLLPLSVIPARGATVTPEIITIATERSALTLAVAGDGRVYQLSYGAPRTHATAPAKTPWREDEFHPPAGNGFILEPALQVVHADGNTSTDLLFQRREIVAGGRDSNVVETRVHLRDPAYPLFVTLCFRAYGKEDVIEQWMEVTHEEPDAVRLTRFASAAPIVKAQRYWLSQFHGDYAREAELTEERLTPGIKVIDSKLGVRAHRFRNPSFLLSLDEPAHEESGEVIGGTLAWSGSFQFAFEVDWRNHLRALCGINPFASDYRLTPGAVFKTPAMLWTWSGQGKGRVSRNFHRWARRYGIRDGDRPRPVLLNNWEATYFNFDEQKIVSLFDGAQQFGIELFLLDDGWFGNKHPRDNDKAGLGDWEVNRRKLPQGLSFLADEARKRGVGFGIWLEPEMVNPASELFERHPEWAIQQPKRELETSRNQLSLDLSHPEVKEFTWKVIEGTLAPNPGITYVKWDANRYLTQPGSTYLSPAEQTHLTIEYQWSLYEVMQRMAERFPEVLAMVCAGGGGRVDYGALKYFHSFWPSDNTDPLQRIYIQWGFSHFFPANTISAHVTDMGNRPPKFACDVALSGAFGVDRDVAKMSDDERRTVTAAVALYRRSLRDVIARGDLYRLESPYEHKRAALSYVSEDKLRAVVFIYQLGEGAFGPVKPRGLDPQRRYRVSEINLPEGATSRLALHGQVVDGAMLMSDGLVSPLRRALESAVVELTAE